MIRERLRLSAIPAVLLSALILLTTMTQARALTPQEKLVEEARLAFLTMIDEPALSGLDRFVRNAKAIIIVPDLIRGGFFVGGEGGTGVLLRRLEDGSWSHPAFVNLASGSFGLQIGGQVAEFALTIMTEQGLNAVLQRSFTLGVDANAAIASLGSGVGASTGLDLDADMYAFSRTQGLFIGGALEGTVISQRQGWNQAYYGHAAAVTEILQGRVSNRHADPLRQALSLTSQT